MIFFPFHNHFFGARCNRNGFFFSMGITVGNHFLLQILRVKVSPHDETLHHKIGDSVDLRGSFNTAYRDTVSCFMVHCCGVWNDLYIERSARCCSPHCKDETVELLHLLKLENERSTPGCLIVQSAIRLSLLRRLFAHW